ncbi:methyltransferase domain-containing protein [Verrucomicrobiaceae bacterium 5K15]|uniref:Methyltransferase domain-containing protein n=1 Tax=Oceaniferula flava TaxID=2800421 RepID=A0AAE2SBW5_9BACT|nr:methyltransferase domain-containing protein [Oceaniferula flavus]MBK1855361.1 methyltransferase domain-containing protein [Oceaniferula flavus]MBM1136667.1 methyltransferase domain-containing protein [Oceaniferula flavus]
MTIGSDTWNERYQSGDTPWDKGTYTPALLEVLAKQVIPAEAEVLVPGCGYGHDAAAIAQAGYPTTGMDIAESAVKGARLAHQGVDGLDFVQEDLFDPTLSEEKRYGAIWEHTCYCAILPEQRPDYVRAVANLLENDGIFAGIFFINTEMPEGEGPPFETSVEEVHQRFSDRFELLWEKSPDATFPTREGCEWLMVWRKKS